ncbi:diguanylate cyclase [Oxalobacteraceae bacterium OM1]|nr:diguanylate cyclase [Oxalobacteraceae bacterium OM1]
MKIETKFRLTALFVFSVMLGVSTVPYFTAAASHATLGDLRDSLARQRQYERLLDVLRDAETGQRGYIITGKDSFLTPYHAAVGELPALRSAMLAATQRTADDTAALQDVFKVVDWKMGELAQTIEMRRDEGFAMVEPVVSSARGKEYMDTLRQRIGALEQAEEARRLSLREKTEHEAERAMYASSAATVVDLALLGILLVLMFRLLGERKAAAAALNDAAGELERNNAEIERRNRWMATSAEMLQALGAISSLDETSRIIATYAAKLLPSVSGTLYLYRNSRDILEAQVSWGARAAHAASLEPTDCWALQRGMPHATHGPDDLCCKHYAAGARQERLCMPLVTQGEVIGLIYLDAGADRQSFLQEREAMIVRMAEQIALALANVKLRETLRRQSIVDPLTGLFNRRYLDETLRRELSRAERKQTPLCVIMMDLDHFKRINDGFGHDAGDAVLKAVAQVVRHHVRESDLACRYGGEEIMLILPECDLAVALDRAERIRAAVAALDIHHAGRTLGAVTASLGVAAYPEHGRAGESLVPAADQALYRAKQEGRNRVLAAP